MAEHSADAGGEPEKSRETAAPLPAGWLSRYPWVTFLLPMVVYMLLGSFDPTPPDAPPTPETEANAEDEPYYPPEPKGMLPEIPYRFYPVVYSVKIALTVATILLVWPGYRTFPFRVSWLGIVVGIVGVVLWIALCHLRLEVKFFAPIDRFLGGLLPWADVEEPSIGLLSILGAGERTAFNPLEQMADTPLLAYVFLAIRFTGLALVVPVIEEFLLARILDALRRERQLVASADRAGKPHRGYCGHSGTDVDAPRRVAGRIRVVQPGDLANGPHPEYLGLRRGARRDQFAAGHLRRNNRQLATDVAATCR